MGEEVDFKTLHFLSAGFRDRGVRSPMPDRPVLFARQKQKK